MPARACICVRGEELFWGGGGGGGGGCVGGWLCIYMGMSIINVFLYLCIFVYKCTYACVCLYLVLFVLCAFTHVSLGFVLVVSLLV